MEAVTGVLNKIQTPTLFHTTNHDWQFVYEPAEDTFLLLDALEKDLEFILDKKPKICMEIGSGSGVIITALSQILSSMTYCLAVDINRYACELTKKTSDHNDAIVEVVEGDMTTCIKDNVVDLIVFNPPYVVTPSCELRSADYLTRSWAGGIHGREVIDRFLGSLLDILDSNGFGYLLLLKENDPENVINVLTENNFKADVLTYRKIRGEELYTVKFERKKLKNHESFK